MLIIISPTPSQLLLFYCQLY